MRIKVETVIAILGFLASLVVAAKVVDILMPLIVFVFGLLGYIATYFVLVGLLFCPIARNVGYGNVCPKVRFEHKFDWVEEEEGN